MNPDPRGLRHISLVDQEGRSMCRPRLGQAERPPRYCCARGPSRQRLPNRITIAAHTSATPDRDQSTQGDWTLSPPAPTPPARSCRTAASIRTGIYQVRKAASDPLFRTTPPCRHRRIAIVLLRESPVVPPNGHP